MTNANYIQWLERMIVGCDELGDMEREKAVYQDCLKKARTLVKNNAALPLVMPRLFFVVEEIEEGVWEQITIGFSTHEEAKAYKDRWGGKHPNAFIVASLNEA